MRRGRWFPRGTPLVVRFWAKVTFPLTSEGIPTDDPDQCWPWGGYIGKNFGYGVGYGQIREDSVPGQRGRLLKAHRVSYLISIGDIPEGWDVCHACDNTICVNPHHLFAAAHRDNMHDYITKYGGLGRPKSPLPVGQLTLLRDTGAEPWGAGAPVGEPDVAPGDYTMGACKSTV